MKFETYLPCKMLSPYIKHFIISENSDAQTYKVLPGTSLVMGFQYAGRLAYVNGQTDTPLATAGITGLMNGYRTFKNTPHIGTLLVVFEETGAARFLKQPVHELFDESLSLDHFFDRRQLAEAEEKLSAANNDRERINIIEQLLIGHLRHHAQDLLVINALTRIHQNRGTIRIADLARELNTSQSPLEKRFRKVVGASPKKFAAIVRIKNVLANLSEPDYEEAVFLSGYYDQAHFIKSFKTFTGSTPAEYRKAIFLK